MSPGCPVLQVGSVIPQGSEVVITPPIFFFFFAFFTSQNSMRGVQL